MYNNRTKSSNFEKFRILTFDLRSKAFTKNTAFFYFSDRISILGKIQIQIAVIRYFIKLLLGYKIAPIKLHTFAQKST